MNEELKTLLSQPTASIPDAGRVCFGLKRQASYRAAKKGDIPTIQVGGNFYVLTSDLRKILRIEAA